MALARYSQKAHARWKTAEEKHAVAAHSLSRERKQRKQLQADLEDTKTRAVSDAAALEKARANSKKWEERMPVINSLMAAVTPMAESVPLDALPIRRSLANTW
jgi:molecular chaperone GrpE (heat shock protein)